MTEKAREAGEANVYPLKIESREGTIVHYGMNLREYYAGLALQGILANEQAFTPSSAAEAVRYADALLEELSKTE